MRRFEDILTGIILIGSTLIAVGIAIAGLFFFLRNSNLIPFTLIFVGSFLILYAIRNTLIGFSVIFHGRYQDDRIQKENRWYTD